MTTARGGAATRRRCDVVVTGLGLVTPAGTDPDQNWARVCRGGSTATRDPRLAGLPADLSCRVVDLDLDSLLGRRTTRFLDRFAQLALVAGRRAVADAGLDPEDWNGARVGVVVGNSLGGAQTWEDQHRTMMESGVGRISPMAVPMGMVNMVAGAVSTDLGARGPSLVPATACAAGAAAVGLAVDLLAGDVCDVVVAGGAEACLTPFVVGALSRLGGLSRRHDRPGAASRPFDRDRDGFVPAEAAGLLVLERANDAAARGARVRSRVLGHATTCDAHHPTAPDPRGRAAEEAVRGALDSAGVDPGDVDHVNAHGTSTPLNDAVEADVIGRVYGGRPAVTSTKGCTGHALGAAGAIEAAFTVMAVEHDVVPPTANLENLDPRVSVDVVRGDPRRHRVDVATSHSFGFGGHNAVLVLASA